MGENTNKNSKVFQGLTFFPITSARAGDGGQPQLFEARGGVSRASFAAVRRLRDEAEVRAAGCPEGRAEAALWASCGGATPHIKNQFHISFVFLARKAKNANVAGSLSIAD
jgi:hypothetical protein